MEMFRRLVLVSVSVAAASCVLAACSNATSSESGALGTSSIEPAAIALDASNQFS